METSIALTEEGVDRESVLIYIWEKVVDRFVEGDYSKAQASFGLFEAIEAMTDEEYSSTCVCDDDGCHCHM